MGRKKKYNTEEEKVQAQREWNKKYYEKNKLHINDKKMEEYYETKIKDLEEKLSFLRERNDIQI